MEDFVLCCAVNVEQLPRAKRIFTQILFPFYSEDKQIGGNVVYLTVSCLFSRKTEIESERI